MQPSSMIRGICLLTLLPGLVLAGSKSAAEARTMERRLRGLDMQIERIMRDWNVPGLGIAVVAGDEVLYERGFGYRDVGRKLPFTKHTVFPIASNTKLFTAVSAGVLVSENKLSWDKPIRDDVPTIRFQSDLLSDNVTLRDMLSHRTGVTRHDMVWFHADLSSEDVFDKLRYLEPAAALRHEFNYNNIMFGAVGQVIKLRSGRTWEEFVRERILAPLDMKSTVFSIEQLRQLPDRAVPYTERRDSDELRELPYYEEFGGLSPAGSIDSTLLDMSHWLIALMNEGRYAGREVIPKEVLSATLQPVVPMGTTGFERRGWHELQGLSYCMGREIASYRGYAITRHGGDLPGFHSQVSFLPNEHIGVLVFVVGDHAAPLYDALTYQIYERLLGLPQTPWAARLLELRKKGRQASQAARGRAGVDRVAGTKPTHPLQDYVGDYVHPAYGRLRIGLSGEGLQFDLHKIVKPLHHYHYDRFDTDDDELDGKWSVGFSINPQGEVANATISIDDADVVFQRREPDLSDEQLQRLVGVYQDMTGGKAYVHRSGAKELLLGGGDGTGEKLIHTRGLRFRAESSSEVVYEFVDEAGKRIFMNVISPSRVDVLTKN